MPWLCSACMSMQRLVPSYVEFECVENCNSSYWFVLCWLYKWYWCYWRSPERERQTDSSCIYFAELSTFHQKTEKQSSQGQSLALSVGLNFVGSTWRRIHNPANWCCWWSPETESSSICWTELCRFHLKTEVDSSLRNMFSIKARTMDNIATNVYPIKHLHGTFTDSSASAVSKTI